MVTVLPESEVLSQLQRLPHWTYQDGHLCRNFTFSDFKQALGFMVQVGLCAETLNHHPEIVNVYNRVNLRLRTHHPDGITALDFDLAQAINALNNPA